MFKFFKEMKNLRKLRTVRKKLSTIDENKLPPEFPYNLLEVPPYFTKDHGDDVTKYIIDVIHGKQSPIRDVSSPKYTYSEKVSMSISFWTVMEQWCAKNKEFCKSTLIDDAMLKTLKKDEENLLRELGL